MIRVRRADPADAEALVALAERVGREEGRWILTTSSWRSAADERRYLRAVQHHADAAVFVVEDDGSVVGRLSLARDPHPASQHVADLGLMVAAGHRRRGLGKALLEEAVRWARDSGIRKLELHVFPWNDPALRLYEAFGFEREGLRREHYARDGEYVDAILMAYRIPGASDFTSSVRRPVPAAGSRVSPPELGAERARRRCCGGAGTRVARGRPAGAGG